MAEGVSKENEESRKPPTECVWDIKYFQDQVLATSLGCVECGHPPKKCLLYKDMMTYCQKCSELLIEKDKDAKVSPNPFADGLIAKAQIACNNILTDPSKKDEEKKEEDKQCEWKGLVKDWQTHNDTDCQYAIINCNDCCEYMASRSLQAAHNGLCGFATIKCPLNCNGDILRKDTENHTKNECSKTILNCTNNECKDEIIRELFTDHVNQQCPKRIVQCIYTQYGCTQPNVKYESMENHIQQFETKHLQFQLNSLYQIINKKQQRAYYEVGMIRMFGGNTIPNGWMLCDGTNGTPDLRDKFIEKNKKQNINGNNGTDDFEISEIEDNDDDDEEDEYHNDKNVQCYSMIYIIKA